METVIPAEAWQHIKEDIRANCKRCPSDKAWDKFIKAYPRGKFVFQYSNDVDKKKHDYRILHLIMQPCDAWTVCPLSISVSNYQDRKDHVKGYVSTGPGCYPYSYLAGTSFQTVKFDSLEKCLKYARKKGTAEELIEFFIQKLKDGVPFFENQYSHVMGECWA